MFGILKPSSHDSVAKAILVLRHIIYNRFPCQLNVKHFKSSINVLRIW